MSTLTFEYKVRDKSGAIQSGTMEATSPGAVAKTLRDKGFMPIRVVETKKSGLDRDIKIPGFTDKVKTKDLSIFSRQLATMVNSGLTLIRSLSILESQIENATLAQTITDVKAKVESGSSLSAALEMHPKIFGTLYISMIRAGEVGGALDETLERLSDTLEAQVRLRSKVKSAMAYPVVVMSLVVFILIAMLVFVVPIFEGMYRDLGGALPAPTQLLINLSSLLTGYWWLFLIINIGSVVGFKRWVATDSGRAQWDRIKLKLPIFGKLTQKVAISRFARTFSVLTRTGVPVLQALEIVSMTAGNTVISDAIADVESSVKRGESLSGPLENHPVFPPMVTQMMAVGEETGALEVMLSKVADFFDREVDDTVNALTSLIEPLLIIVMGVSVGGILICLYLPMFNIANLIQN